ncbi:MAG: hypothetical protein ACRDGV_09545 [Candidatus Limnocylindria bacterium]
MTQFQEFISAPALASTERKMIRSGRFVLAFISLVVLVAAIGVGAIVLSQQLQPGAAPTDERAATDGWLPAITAANEARRFAAASETVDGWIPRLVAQPNDHEILDGWAVRYLASDED